MKRLLILIFAFNALFITPVSAMGGCEMMDEATVEMSSNDMSEMDCPQCEEANCSSLQCGFSSYAATPALLSEKLSFNIVEGNYQPQTDLAYFYTITYPVNTPPPLV